MASNYEWLQQKIKGSFAEDVCEAHFEAMGYTVERMGVEHIAPKFAFLNNSLYKQHFQKTPDIVAMGDKRTFLIEVKFRKKVEKMEAFETELFWTYRNMIFSEEFKSDAFKNTAITEKIWFEEDSLYRTNYKLCKEVVDIYTKTKSRDKYTKLDILFYAIIKESDDYVYLNYSKMPYWIRANDESLERYNFYKGIVKTYNEVVYPVMLDFFECVKH